MAFPLDRTIGSLGGGRTRIFGVIVNAGFKERDLVMKAGLMRRFRLTVWL